LSFQRGSIISSVLFVFFGIPIWSQSVLAQETREIQPYIEELKQQMSQEDASEPRRNSKNPEPYIQELKEGLDPESKDSKSKESYIDVLKESDPGQFEEAPKGSYTESEKAKLEPKKDDSAIKAFNEGRSKLEAKRLGEIRHAAGLRVGTNLTRNITANEGFGRRPFNDVYGGKWAPDLNFFYEFQPFHSEWFGNIGIVLGAGVAFFRGVGSFQFNLINPLNNKEFTKVSQTQFQFYTFPVSLGLNYRFNLLKYLRPYVQVSPTAVGYLETRNDKKKSLRGYSTALTYSGGLALLLNWLSPKSAWSMYEAQGVHQYYLTLDYTRMTPLGGDVNFNVSGVSAGLTFEF